MTARAAVNPFLREHAAPLAGSAALHVLAAAVLLASAFFSVTPRVTPPAAIEAYLVGLPRPRAVPVVAAPAPVAPPAPVSEPPAAAVREPPPAARAPEPPAKAVRAQADAERLEKARAQEAAARERAAAQKRNAKVDG